MWNRESVGRLSVEDDGAPMRHSQGLLSAKQRFGWQIRDLSEIQLPCPSFFTSSGRVRYFLAYQPSVSDLSSILPKTDVLVVNFGLHFLFKERDNYREVPDKFATPGELRFTYHRFRMPFHRQVMTAVLSSLVPFAGDPSRVLVWRETSAQHHAGEGGEWPPNRRGKPSKETIVLANRPLHAEFLTARGKIRSACATVIIFVRSVELSHGFVVRDWVLQGELPCG
jgi:hypothetical protein